jgi:uncharacterized membrane protein (Fun14 family)
MNWQYPERLANGNQFLGIFENIVEVVTGTLAGLPTPLLMAPPFILGAILGYFLKKLIKWVLVITIIAIVGSFLGFFNLASASTEARGLIARYGPEALNYLTLTVGVLPLGAGFILGFAIGFLLA